MRLQQRTTKYQKEPIRAKENNKTKNTGEGIRSRLGHTEHVSDTEDRIVEITQLEQQKEFLNMRIV